MKFIFICIITFVLAVSWFSHAESNSYNILQQAYMEDETYLSFYGEVDWNNYEVNVKNQVEYLTWDEWEGKHCFPLLWTGYTDTMWEVYFWYDNEDSYICSDWNYYWKAKLSAGGWIEFQEQTTDVIDIDVNKFKDEIDDNFFYHTWYALSDGVWIWNWDNVKTEFQPRAEVYDTISPEKSSINTYWTWEANLEDKKNLEFILKDDDKNKVEWVFADKLEIWTWDFETKENQNWLFFSWKQESLENISFGSWKIEKDVMSIVPWDWEVSLDLSYFENSLTIKDKIDWFDLPFDLKFDVDNEDEENLIWEYYEWNIYKSGAYDDVSDIEVSTWTFAYSWDYDYNIKEGRKIFDISEFNFEFLPQEPQAFSSDWIGVDEEMYVYYDISGSYSFENFWKIPFNGQETDKQKFVPDKNIKNITPVSSCNAVANWIDACNKFLIIENDQYRIPWLDLHVWFSWDQQDFDLLKTEEEYSTGVFLSGSKNISTNDKWITMVNISSYVPVNNWELEMYAKERNNKENKINFELENLEFESPVELTFTWANIGEWIALNEDNKITVVYQPESDNISKDNEDINLYLTGMIEGCNECEFESGGIITSDEFGEWEEEVYISWTDQIDSISYYWTDYEYKLKDWIKWDKTVSLEPDVEINWNLDMAWIFYGMNLEWTIADWYDHTIDVGSNYQEANIIWSDISLYDMISDVRKNIFEEIRGASVVQDNYIVISQLNNTGQKVYDCNWWKAEIDLSNPAEWYNELIFIDCAVHIKDNIELAWNDWEVNIVSLQDDMDIIDYNESNWWEIDSNIYIYPEVDTIISDLTTDWAIFTLKNDNVDKNSVFFGERYNTDNIKRQLFIKWDITSRNTYGGWIIENEEVTFPWDIYYEKHTTWLFEIWKDALHISQAFDINFWRATYVDQNKNYDTDKLSDYVEDNYNCDWDASDDDICFYPVVIQSW